jgi:hypothetical protein
MGAINFHLDEDFLQGEHDRGGGIVGGVAVAATARRTARSTSAGPFRRRTRGQTACCSAGFLRREIKCDPQSVCSWRRRTGQAEGTSEHTDRASDLLRRESECCCRNGSDLMQRESDWCRKEKTETSNNNVRL